MMVKCDDSKGNKDLIIILIGKAASQAGGGYATAANSAVHDDATTSYATTAPTGSNQYGNLTVATSQYATATQYSRAGTMISAQSSSGQTVPNVAYVSADDRGRYHDMRLKPDGRESNIAGSEQSNYNVSVIFVI